MVSCILRIGSRNREDTETVHHKARVGQSLVRFRQDGGILLKSRLGSINKCFTTPVGITELYTQVYTLTMASSTFTFVLEIVLSFVVIGVIGFGRITYRQWQNTAKGRRLGCEPAPKVPSAIWDPLDLRFLPQVLAAVKNGTFLSDWIPLGYKRVGDHAGRDVDTFLGSFMGSIEVITKDPKNLQALLATQFEDFGLESFRLPMRDLLGYGIFTVDGAHWTHSRSLLRPSFARDQINDLEIEDRHCRAMLDALPVGKMDGQTQLTSNPYSSGKRSIVPCLLYTSPSPRDGLLSRMPSSA